MAAIPYPATETETWPIDRKTNPSAHWRINIEIY